MTFLRNHWYAAGWSDEVSPGQVMARTILGEAVAIFRSEGGIASILTDRCPHRLFPLSCGTVQGEAIECGYHGMQFDGNGVCVRIPGQTQVPVKARVRSYPAVERHGVIWVWMGAAEQADPSDIFEVLHSGSSLWTRSQTLLTYASHHLNVTDNLVDPAHTSFVHRRTLGGAGAAEIPVQTTRDATTVTVSRWIENSTPVPMMQKYFGFKGQVDRWQYYHWYRPPVLCVDFGAIDTGKSRTEDERDAGFRIYSWSFVTPETESSTHFFSLQLRNFAVGDAEVTRQLVDDFTLTYEEDRVVLERIQLEQKKAGSTHEIRLAIDAAAVQVRRMHEQLLAEEARTSVATAPVAIRSA